MMNECEVKFNHMGMKYHIKGEFKNYIQKFKGFTDEDVPIYELNLKMMFLENDKIMVVEENDRHN